MLGLLKGFGYFSEEVDTARDKGASQIRRASQLQSLHVRNRGVRYRSTVDDNPIQVGFVDLGFLAKQLASKLRISAVGSADGILESIPESINVRKMDND